MCCIFTCCGWVIDLVQRLWTFAMSCCISSAVCCLMMTSSMSGIALGYNYSLAEYIDLKETNVSVYLKRGVFDDEIADDMEWRRSGRLPVAGHIGDDNLMTGAPAEDGSTPLRSGRRLDDSLFESEDPNKFEGSLMKLTAQPPYPGTTTSTTTGGPEYAEMERKFEPGSLDQLKAIQAMVNARKSSVAKYKSSPKTTYADVDDRYIARLSARSELPPEVRRMMPDAELDRMNPARLAVPPNNIGSEENWLYPKNPRKYYQRFSYSDIDYPVFSPTYPKAIHLNTAPIRPTKPTPTPEMRTYEPENSEVSKPSKFEDIVRPEMNPAMKAFKEKLLLDKYEAPEVPIPKKSKEPSDDYEEDVRGLPVRRRRSITEENGNAPKIVNEEGIMKDSIVFPPNIKINNNGVHDNNMNHEVIETKHSVSSSEKNKELFELQKDKSKKKISLLEDKIDDIIKKDLKSLRQRKPRPKSLADITENLNSKSSSDMKTMLHRIWLWFQDNPPFKRDRKFLRDIEPTDDRMTIADRETLGMGLSLNDIKPISSSTIMVRILKSTIV